MNDIETSEMFFTHQTLYYKHLYTCLFVHLSNAAAVQCIKYHRYRLRVSINVHCKGTAGLALCHQQKEAESNLKHCQTGYCHQRGARELSQFS